MSIDPIELGYIPVMIEERLGAHTPYTENMRVNRTPSAANKLMLGALIVESPYGGRKGLMSSQVIQIILGFDCAKVNLEIANKNISKSKGYLIRLFLLFDIMTTRV
jgi:hypothetical protein